MPQRTMGNENGICRYRVGKAWAHATSQKAEGSLKHCPIQDAATKN